VDSDDRQLGPSFVRVAAGLSALILLAALAIAGWWLYLLVRTPAPTLDWFGNELEVESPPAEPGRDYQRLGPGSDPRGR